MMGFIKNISLLSKKVKLWKKEKKKENMMNLEVIEEEIEILQRQVDEDYFLRSRKERLVVLHSSREKILTIFYCKLRRLGGWKEELLLENGDKNTNIFHSFANQRRVSNSIWELKNQNGVFKLSKLFKGGGSELF